MSRLPGEMQIPSEPLSRRRHGAIALVVLALGSVSSASLVTTAHASVPPEPIFVIVSIGQVAPGTVAPGQTVTAAATLSTVGDPEVDEGTVTFEGRQVGDDGAQIGPDLPLATVPAVGPEVTATFPAPGPGYWGIQAIYSGSPRFLANESAFRVLVVTSATSVALDSSANPSRPGEPVTLTATVTDAFGAMTEGTVTFSTGETVAVDGNGQASVTLPALAPGTHDVTASYSGTTVQGHQIHLPSSTALTQVVAAPDLTTTSTPPTTAPPTTAPPMTAPPTTAGPTTAPVVTATETVIASSANPSRAGQPVIFTVTITAASGAAELGFRRAAARLSPAQVAGGTVTISDGGEVIGQVVVEGGVASHTTSSLSVGRHTITAAYSGSATTAPSSASFVQQVDPAAPSSRLPATR